MANIGFHFNASFTSSVQYRDSIDRLVYDNGHTNTTGGLRAARMELFARDRPDVPDVILLMTDGKPTREEGGLISEASRIKADGIQLIGVGVGSDVDANLIRSLVTTPPNDFYFPVSDFNSLRNRLDSIVGATCRAVVSTTTQPLNRMYSNSERMGH